ncbi:L-asparaginase II [Xylaria castorea]|nr:L-asparaginase II [Xylaria castorea]
MAGAKAIGAGVADYHTQSHPIQARIESVMEDLTSLSVDEHKWVLDSCNMCTPAIPPQSLVRVLASLRTQAMARIFDAMVRYPDNIGSDGRFCSVLIKTYDGALVGKGGGDGCYAVGIRESEDTRRVGAQGGIGIALKIED